MPFSVEKKVEGAESSVVTISLENISGRSKRGKEIEVSAELNVFVDMYSESNRCVLTQVVVGDNKEQDDCALQIYVVKPNQTVWDIAKELSVSQELILQQNESVSLPLKVGEKLVVYRTNLMKY
jgi:LysM repeat protein